MSTTATQAAAAVRLEQVSKTYGRGASATHALDGVSLSVTPGSFTCLIGASGCGKSTLLSLVAGLDAPSAGAVDVGGRRVALMFQEPALFPWLPAAGNVELALRARGVPRAERRRRARELLDVVALGGFGAMRPHELSGGMRQRVMLAAAMLMRPKLLICDEPTTALDVTIGAQILALLHKLNQEFGVGILFISHDLGAVSRLCERVLIMQNGRIVESGAADTLFENPQAEYTKKLISSLAEGRRYRE
jgi:NitT/TauT family transport system ATP-binding protein